MTVEFPRARAVGACADVGDELTPPDGQHVGDVISCHVALLVLWDEREDCVKDDHAF